ncbi:hypothetical protein CFE70_009541 [Pyrenophora teres f. teres 0-1]|uniref:Uncharacterized protein n=1 Tax=Pyrenophora teres f. teres TaxID=97479 RepID=A0A6S6WFE3_9PLEO|nr:hypothetical protein HRS9139_09157 [Pyrenophora teres f. teres]KAE8825055.1 hypothetical protein HRS9122_10154 [Pyrenophora teres f. teres]KAE8855031.1 hypothetical protein PTNB29_09282 [Pyrenophora teres f. teres]KAK1916719.1 hypothetical protein P3342_012363 [Pyrenophora teres f. teres]CAE7212321.1 hypothetical protein PTTW11_10285 [Pyrenophora teres f. teres]
MAGSKNVASAVAIKKVKGLMDFKKAQKEKTDVIEVNDTEEVVENNTVATTDVTITPAADALPETDSTQLHDNKLDPATSAFVIGSSLNTKYNPATKGSVVGTSTSTNLHPTAKDFVDPTMVATPKSLVSPEITATPTSAIIIIAHRKALEAALYDNMETSRAMLMRCKYTASVDAEYHSSIYDGFAKETPSKAKCLDTNGFEIIPLVTGLSLADVTNSIPSTPLLSVDDLFRKVSATGASKIGAAESTEKLKVDPWASISQLLPSTSVYQTGRTLAFVEAEMRSQSSSATATSQGSRSLADVEVEMRDNLTNSTCPASFMDPAIVSCKIEEQPPVDDSPNISSTSPSTLSPPSSHTTRTTSPVHLDSKVRIFTPITPRNVSLALSAECGAGEVDAQGVVDGARLVKSDTLELMLQEHLKMPPCAYFGNFKVIARGLGFPARFGSACY